jgi:GntR family transcriptional regulator, arabinose operon transcriptional repressor
MNKQSAHRNRYADVYETLKQEILTGDIRPGSRFPSDSNLAARFKVSRPTVAKAVMMLRDKGLIQRRAGAASRVIGNREAGSESSMFGLLIPALGETEIFEPICGHIASLSRKHQFNLLWDGAGGFEDDGGKQLLETVDRYISLGVAGIFFTPLELVHDGPAINRAVLEKLDANGIAVTLLDRDSVPFPERGGHDLIGIDNLGAGYVVAGCLIASGCSRIGFLDREGLAPTVSMRRHGVELAIRYAGLAPDVLKIIPVGPSIKACVDAVLRAGIDGLICYNDALAADVMRELLERGTSIPGDISMAGFDDVRYAKHLRVPLTTIHQPCRALGAAAVSVMMDRLKNPDAPPRKVELKAELVIRQSTRKL